MKEGLKNLFSFNLNINLQLRIHSLLFLSVSYDVSSLRHAFFLYRTSIHCDFVIMPPYFVEVSAYRLSCLFKFSYFYSILFLTPHSGTTTIRRRDFNGRGVAAAVIKIYRGPVRCFLISPYS
jgi:hypothetical protein